MGVICGACRARLPLADEEPLPTECPDCGEVGTLTLAGYRLVRRVQRGGMGTVYEATHQDLGTPVAIKVLRDAGSMPSALRERFAREARLTGRIRHPGVVRVYAYGEEGGRLYFVMEFLEGRTVRDLLADGPLAFDEALRVAAALLDVLQAAHDVGVVHRDVKPENILVDATGAVRVLDFGISKLLDEGDRLTATGDLLGTPEYMAPEQILESPDDVSPRTDVYAAGVVLYEMLTGRSPFAGTNVFQVLRAVESLDPIAPSHARREISASLDSLILSAVAKEPTARPESARAFHAALGATRTQTPVTAGRARDGTPWMQAALGVLVLCVARWADQPQKVIQGGDVPGFDAQRIERVWSRLDAVDPPASGELSVLLSDLEGVSARAPSAVQGLIIRKHLGQVVAAHREAKRLAQESSRAAEEAAVTWHYLHTLPPLLMPEFWWLLAPGEDETKDVLGLWGEKRTDLPTDVIKACTALAAGDGDGTLESVRRWTPTGLRREDKALLEAMALLWKGDRDAARSVVSKALDGSPTSVLLTLCLGALSEGEVREAAFATAMEQLPRTSPDRYRWEMVIAIGSRELPRLRAALELVLVCGGEGGDALTWYAAARVIMAETLARSDPLVRDQVDALEQRLLDGPRVWRAGVWATTHLLRCAVGDPSTAEPPLDRIVGLGVQRHEVFRALSEGGEFASFFLGLLYGTVGWTARGQSLLVNALGTVSKDPALSERLIARLRSGAARGPWPPGALGALKRAAARDAGWQDLVERMAKEVGFVGGLGRQ